ncbi:MAG: alpha-L-glutamate ligase [Kiloniellales bacterium]|nr:alpha-L-glutamate ligase [Kiloniellales bacterium]
MAKIHVLHENAAWLGPLRAAFEELGLPYEEWFLDQGLVPFDEAPPEGVFYNRMSASSHTRGHRFAPELTHATLNWLETHGRRVVNSSRALYLEVSKIAQYAALNRAGIRTPRSVAAVGRAQLLQAARDFGEAPFIVKPNRGGKGLGVHLFHDAEELAARLDAAPEEAPIDGIWLVQSYIRAPAPVITRCEFVGGRFLYAVEVDTREGFELCPSDVCAVEGAGRAPVFRVLEGFDDPITHRYARFLADNGIEISGIEFIRDVSGEIFTYDVNTNTNYNPEAEAAAGGPYGMKAIASFLGEELGRLRAPATGIAAE